MQSPVQLISGPCRSSKSTASDSYWSPTLNNRRASWQKGKWQIVSANVCKYAAGLPDCACLRDGVRLSLVIRPLCIVTSLGRIFVITVGRQLPG